MDDQQTFRNFFADVWAEIEHILDTEELADRNLAKLRILGSIQAKADVFGIEREAIGIPTEDADALFIRRVARS